MINGSTEYRSAAAFRKALDARLRVEAKSMGRPMDNLRREFVFQRLLALLFVRDDNEWVLKGGGGLLMRLAGARFSKDLDLTHTRIESREDAVEALKKAIEPQDADWLTFGVVGQPKYSGENLVVTVTVRAAIGVTEYVSFSIDLSTDEHMLFAPERVIPRPVVEVPGLPEPPEIVIYPISDQVADKVCAMYELHGTLGSPSNRYRDLVDLVLIVQQCELDSDNISQALRSEAARRGMTLPASMHLPSPAWTAGYRQTATAAAIPEEFRDAAAALAFVAEVIDPMIAAGR
jgi:predicted nucleotidyltransferase component of viral defense system